jgi:hypothetical protein
MCGLEKEFVIGAGRHEAWAHTHPNLLNACCLSVWICIEPVAAWRMLANSWEYYFRVYFRVDHLFV